MLVTSVFVLLLGCMNAITPGGAVGSVAVAAFVSGTVWEASGLAVSAAAFVSGIVWEASVVARAGLIGAVAASGFVSGIVWVVRVGLAVAEAASVSGTVWVARVAGTIDAAAGLADAAAVAVSGTVCWVVRVAGCMVFGSTSWSSHSNSSSSSSSTISSSSSSVASSGWAQTYFRSDRVLFVMLFSLGPPPDMILDCERFLLLTARPMPGLVDPEDQLLELVQFVGVRPGRGQWVSRGECCKPLLGKACDLPALAMFGDLGEDI